MISGTLGCVGVTIRHVMGLMGRLIESGCNGRALQCGIGCGWECEWIDGRVDGQG
jgi:hypothetical protein